MKIEFVYEDDDGNEVEASLPARYEVCHRCEGHGTHLHPAIGEHAYTPEEFNESFFEDEDKEEYFKHGGKYDVACEECHGNRVVLEVDEEACKKACKRDPKLKELLIKYYEKGREDAEYKRLCAAERKFGC